MSLIMSVWENNTLPLINRHASEWHGLGRRLSEYQTGGFHFTSMS